MSSNESDSDQYMDHSFDENSNDFSDGSNEGSFEAGSDDGNSSSGEQLDSDRYKFTAQEKKALATGKIGPSKREKRKREESIGYTDDSSDEDLSNDDDDTPRPYSRPNLNHIKDKTKNTSPSFAFLNRIVWY